MATVAQAGGAQRRDVAPARQAAFRATAKRVVERFFDSVYGDRQIHLQILGVHPDHWRRGVGSKLVRWGMDKAEEEEMPLTLLAGSVGFHLYSSLGFRQVGSTVFQVPGEAEAIDAKAMVYEPVPQC